MVEGGGEMKALVFGATGQLGAYSAKHLLDQGHDVVAVGRRESDNGFWGSAGAEYIGGVSLEDEHCMKKLPISGIDAVVHLAGAMPAHVGTSPLPYVRSIVDGMVNVCEWMKRIGCKRIVFNTTPSDVSQHFSKDPVPEDASVSFPHDGGDHAIYSIAKNAAVDILTHYQIAEGFKPCVFRHMTVYGWHPNQYYFKNGERRILPFRKIINDVIAGGPVEVWGNPHVRKELLYIKDFVTAIQKAVECEVCGLFNLPGYKHYTTEDQIDGFITGFATKPVEKVYCPEKPSSPENLLELGGAKTQLGWTPIWNWTSACRDWAVLSRNNPFPGLWDSE